MSVKAGQAPSTRTSDMWIAATAPRFHLTLSPRSCRATKAAKIKRSFTWSFCLTMVAATSWVVDTWSTIKGACGVRHQRLGGPVRQPPHPRPRLHRLEHLTATEVDRHVIDIPRRVAPPEHQIPPLHPRPGHMPQARMPIQLPAGPIRRQHMLVHTVLLRVKARRIQSLQHQARTIQFGMISARVVAAAVPDLHSDRRLAGVAGPLQRV
jgi:hypothetical protein